MGGNAIQIIVAIAQLVNDRAAGAGLIAGQFAEAVVAVAVSHLIQAGAVQGAALRHALDSQIACFGKEAAAVIRVGNGIHPIDSQRGQAVTIIVTIVDGAVERATPGDRSKQLVVIAVTQGNAIWRGNAGQLVGGGVVGVGGVAAGLGKADQPQGAVIGIADGSAIRARLTGYLPYRIVCVASLCGADTYIGWGIGRCFLTQGIVEGMRRAVGRCQDCQIAKGIVAKADLFAIRLGNRRQFALGGVGEAGGLVQRVLYAGQLIGGIVGKGCGLAFAVGMGSKVAVDVVAVGV